MFFSLFRRHRDLGSCRDEISEPAYDMLSSVHHLYNLVSLARYHNISILSPFSVKKVPKNPKFIEMNASFGL